MRNRLLSLFLVVVLLVTICPIANAEGVSETNDEEISTLAVEGNPTRCGEKGIALIKSFESCRLTAYKASSSEQYYTIGWGHYGADVTPGMTITQEEADALFVQDLARFESYLNTFLNKNNISVNQSQYDALLSFTYNLGNVWVSYSAPDFRLRNYLRDGIGNYTEEEIRAAFVAWNTAGGQVLAGLTRRRNEECDLFLSEIHFPKNPWIESDKTIVEVGGEITFNFGATDATKYTVKIDRLGAETVEYLTKDVNTGSYTATFDESGVYSIYAVCQNSDGSIDSSSITVTVYSNIGTGFTTPIFHKDQDKYLENNSNTGSVFVADEDSTANQQWYFERQADGSYKISSCYDGKYLTVNNDTVQLSKNNGFKTQKWYIWEEARGYILKSMSSSQVLHLTSDNNAIVTKPYDGLKTQIWELDIEEDALPQKSTLTVTPGNYTTETYFSWTEAYGAKGYNLKIWQNDDLNGDAYLVANDVSSNYSVVLPSGTYSGYVEAYHEYGVQAGDPVTFTVSDHITIDFDANGGTGAPASQQKIEGTDLILSNAIPSKTGYTFKEWNTKADGSGTGYTSEATYSTDKAATLYAQWTANRYTVEYNANGGVGEMSDSTFIYDSEYNLSKNTFTRAEHVFLGWSTNPSATSTEYKNNCTVINLTDIADGKVTLYAVWTEISNIAGDVDNDFMVTNADLVSIARLIVNLESEDDLPNSKNGDMDKDGIITNADLVIVAKMIVGLE